jgi:hypothetical protein
LFGHSIGCVLGQKKRKVDEGVVKKRKENEYNNENLLKG